VPCCTLLFRMWLLEDHSSIGSCQALCLCMLYTDRCVCCAVRRCTLSVCKHFREIAEALSSDLSTTLLAECWCVCVCISEHRCKAHQLTLTAQELSVQRHAVSARFCTARVLRQCIPRILLVNTHHNNSPHNNTHQQHTSKATRVLAHVPLPMKLISALLCAYAVASPEEVSSSQLTLIGLA